MAHDPYLFHFCFGILLVLGDMKENIIFRDRYYCFLLVL